MALSALGLHQFGGLNLRDAVDEVGADGAIDLLNVDFDIGGAVRQRDGWGHFTSGAGASLYAGLARTHDGLLITSRPADARVVLINGAGAEGSTLVGALLGRVVHFGTPSASYTYATDRLGSLIRWTGAALTRPSATVDGVGGSSPPAARVIGVQANDNRLVVGSTNIALGGPGGASSTTSHVWFSDAGNAESWTSTNYVQLTPGDNEEIQEIVSWNNQLFVFKQSRLFVFYGNSTDSSGNPVFNYRTVELRRGLVSAGTTSGYAQGPVAVASPNGVYFLTTHGIQLTTGGDPVEVSNVVRPLFSGVLPETVTTSRPRSAGTTATPSQMSLAWHQGRLFCSYAASGSSANDRILVYDPDQETWTIWGVPAGSLLHGSSTSDELYFARSDANHIGKLGSSYTQDNGSNIASHYQTGFYDMGSEFEKRVRETRLWGVGTVAYSSAADFGSVGSATNVTLGTSPAVAQGVVSKQQQGTLISHKLASVSGGAWRVHRLTQLLQPERVPAIK